MNNPHNAVCPVYGAPAFAQERQTFIDLGLTNEQAILGLNAAWKKANDLAILVWDNDIATEIAAAEAKALALKEAEVLIEKEKEQECVDAEKEARKKHKAKYTVVHSDLHIPDTKDNLLSPAVSTKTKKFEYVHLYHFTNEALDAVDYNPTSEANNMGKVIQNDDGVLEFVAVNAPKTSSHVKADKDLSINDFCIATPRLIQAMVDASWPEDRLSMFAEFWNNLQCHKWRSSRKMVETRALLLYQDVQRQKWHVRANAAMATTKLYS